MRTSLPSKRLGVVPLVVLALAGCGTGDREDEVGDSQGAGATVTLPATSTGESVPGGKRYEVPYVP